MGRKRGLLEHRDRGLEVIEQRYLRLGVIVALIGCAAAFATPATVTQTVLRAALCAANLGFLWLLHRPTSVARIATTFVLTLWLSLLALAFTRMADGWPPWLGLMPAAIACSSLLGGARLANVLTVVSMVVITAAYALPLAPRPPFLAFQLSNWLLAMAMMRLFMSRVVSVLRTGAAELAASSEVVVEAERTSRAIEALLVERVERAVTELATALRETPGRAVVATKQLAAILTAGRSAVPPEPPAGQFDVEAQLAELRERAIAVSFRIGIPVLGFQVLRNMHLGLWEQVPQLMAQLACVTTGAALMRWVPRARRVAFVVFWVAVFGGASASLWTWFIRAPIAPPILPTWTLATVLLGFTAGRTPAVIASLLVALISLVALHEHPGLPASVPIIFAIAGAALSWVLAGWPRDLLVTLQARRARAADLLRARRRLVATLFHDLANPVTSVMFDLDEIAAEEAPPGTLAQVADVVDGMHATIAAALGKVADDGLIDASRQCQELERRFRGRLRSRHVTLAVAPAPGAMVRGDVALLRDSVLANLLTNAIKFSPEGAEIELAVTCERRAVTIEVRDRGAGIPPEVVSAVRAGARAPSTSGLGGENGTGFGLLLAREYVEAMGGQLELLARTGGGTIARVVLPAC